jgi:hypothetical protein
VHLKPKMTPLLSRLLQDNIRASLDKLALRNRGVGQKKNSGPLPLGQSVLLRDIRGQIGQIKANQGEPVRANWRKS